MTNKKNEFVGALMAADSTMLPANTDGLGYKAMKPMEETKMDRYLLGTIKVPRGKNWVDEANKNLEELGLHARHVIAIIPRLGDMEIIYQYLNEKNP